MWKETVQNPDYLVSDEGDVKLKNGDIMLTKTKQKNGYLTVGIKIDGILKRFYVHRVVAQAFLPNPRNCTDVNHIDYNKENNKLSNLEWCTRSENLKHSYQFPNRDKCRERARQLVAENHEKMKISIKQYSLSGEFIAEYSSITEAAKATGVPTQNISEVTRGKRITAGGYKWIRDDVGSMDFGQLRPRFTAVQQLDLEGNVIATFDSIAEASRQTGANAKSISEVCRGRYKTSGGFKWRTVT